MDEEIAKFEREQASKASLAILTPIIKAFQSAIQEIAKSPK
jgi:hypothetical protein